MSMSKRRRERQPNLWINTAEIVRSPGHPFYQRLHLVLAKLDRKRPKKGSNQEWKNPNDPDARIAKMKDGRTHLAHKAEHAVDLETGAVLAVTLQGADQGDTTTIQQTLSETANNLAYVQSDPQASEHLGPGVLAEVVTDKGYHRNETMRDLQQQEIRSYVSEPRHRGRRRWKSKGVEQQAVYANRRRIREERGKRLLRKRGELLERPFAHCYETGGMRRTHLRSHARILKRLLVHVAGCNLGLLMRRLFGIGTPRGLQGLISDFLAVLLRLVQRLWPVHTPVRHALGTCHPSRGGLPQPMTQSLQFMSSSTGC